MLCEHHRRLERLKLAGGDRVYVPERLPVLLLVGTAGLRGEVADVFVEDLRG